MKSKLLLNVALCLVLVACQNSPTTTELESIKNPVMAVNYPESLREEIVEDYHGTQIPDPYRWLEVDTSNEVKAWVGAQNEVTFDYLKKIPYRKKIEERFTELFNYPKLSSPFKAGDYYFFYKNDGLQNQAVIYVQKGLEGEPEVFIDPNTLSEDGTVAVSLLGFSEDKKYVAYSQSVAGSDWREIKVKEIGTKQELPDLLKWVKFSGASWKGDGFYYSRYPEPEAGTELSGNNQYHSVYFHKMGTDQSEDQLIYEDRENPGTYHWTGVSEDHRFLYLYAAPGTDGFSTYAMDLDGDKTFKLLFPGTENRSSVVHNIDNELLVLTNIDAPKYRLIKVDWEQPEPANWKDVIPEGEDLLQSVSTGGKKIFANYLKSATDRFFQYEYDGSGKKEIELPGLGSGGGFNGDEEDTFLFYTFSSFIYPNTIFKYDISAGTSEAFFKTPLKFDPAAYEEKQVFYPSKDGTPISMFIVHKKGLELNGNNPTYLYGYGGFNVSLTPWFSASRLILLENDGVFALPNLRGGGEYGEEWHKAGMLDKKQNVFDDFIAAAEYLIKENYTSSDKLAIAGGSNGGLLVGACMTQRPELFGVAFPAVGVMDMLRFHKFTVGKAWVPEYGSSNNPDDFKNLLSYSPLHNLKEDQNYPATMITTADHDDRVVPAHSFKFAAQLQHVHEGENPVLIRIETDAGHGAGKPTSKIIEEQADMWAFMFYNTNAPVKYLDN